MNIVDSEAAPRSRQRGGHPPERTRPGDDFAGGREGFVTGADEAMLDICRRHATAAMRLLLLCQRVAEESVQKILVRHVKADARMAARIGFNYRSQGGPRPKFPVAERHRLLDQLLREIGGLSLSLLRYPEKRRRRPLKRAGPPPQAAPETDAHAGAGLMLQGAGRIGALIARQGDSPARSTHGRRRDSRGGVR